MSLEKNIQALTAAIVSLTNALTETSHAVHSTTSPVSGAAQTSAQSTGPAAAPVQAVTPVPATGAPAPVAQAPAVAPPPTTAPVTAAQATVPAPAPAPAEPLAAEASPPPTAVAYTHDQVNEILVGKYHELVQTGADGAKVQALLQAKIGPTPLAQVPAINLGAIVDAVQAVTAAEIV